MCLPSAFQGLVYGFSVWGKIFQYTDRIHSDNNYNLLLLCSGMTGAK